MANQDGEVSNSCCIGVKLLKEMRMLRRKGKAWEESGVHDSCIQVFEGLHVKEGSD